eukprot:scaffold31110_cov76-Cyclotella_meneghiniana.AAC.1
MVVALLYHFLNFGNERSEFLLYSLFDWRDLIRLIVSFSTVVSEFDLKLCSPAHADAAGALGLLIRQLEVEISAIVF